MRKNEEEVGTGKSKFESVPLGDVVKFERTTVLPGSFRQNDICLSLEHIQPDGTIHIRNHADGDPKSSKFRFDSRHVLYGKLRPYLNKVARPDFAGICSTDILPILPGPKIDRDYLFHALRTSEFTRLATSRSVGVNLPRVSPYQLSTFEIPLPTLTIQKRIAAILDKADAIRKKRQQAITLADDFLRATFLDMFGDPVTNPKGWTRMKLGELVEPDRPITYGILKPGKNTPDGIPMLRIQDIKNGEIDQTNIHYVSGQLSHQYRRTILKGGEIVISLVGTIGLVARVPGSLAGANLHRNLGLISPSDKINPVYLHSLMSLPSFSELLRKVTKGGIQSLLNLSDLNSIPISVPKQTTQIKFERFALGFFTLQKKNFKANSLAELLFDSSVAQAFRGEL
jgi:type I restriction enzyme, S subunit